MSYHSFAAARLADAAPRRAARFLKPQPRLMRRRFCSQPAASQASRRLPEGAPAFAAASAAVTTSHAVADALGRALIADV